MTKVLMKGNEAIAKASILAGCEAYFGYPITPQIEVIEYMSHHMVSSGRVFVQAESELAAINMVYGAAGAGGRAMTSSSSPGIALMQEGISYLCGAELPCVVVNVMRGGPGLGGIQPSQADYNQITRGGGNGDYKVLSYAPENLQETVDLIKKAFDVADQYRNPVMIAVDGLMGQMMETVDLDKPYVARKLPQKTWATTGSGVNETRRIVNSLYLDPAMLEKHNLKLNEKYHQMAKNETMVETIDIEDCDYVLVAFVTMARIARSAIAQLKDKGIKVGLIRPITLWPYPSHVFSSISSQCKGILVAELNLGQMIQDVQIANQGILPIGFYGRAGGMLPEPEELVEAIVHFKKVGVTHE
jgi:2-oxoglutarate ferredoxin oxidoreductase subunit alpha